MVDLAACDSYSSRSTGGASDAAEYAGEAKRRNPGTQTGGNVLWVMYCIYRQIKTGRLQIHMSGLVISQILQAIIRKYCKGARCFGY